MKDQLEDVPPTGEVTDSQPPESEEFSSMAQEFQAIEAPSPDLARLVERGRKSLVRGNLLGVFIALTLTLNALYVLNRDRDAAAVVFAVMQIGVPVVVLWFVRRSRRDTWQARANTTRAFLELELERRRDWIRRMGFLRRVTPFIAGLIALHQIVLAVTSGGLAFAASAVGSLFVLAIPYLILAALFWHAGLRRKRFQAQADGLSRQIDDLSAEPREARSGTNS